MVTFNQYRTRSGVGAISSLDCMRAEKEVISSLLLWNRDLYVRSWIRVVVIDLKSAMRCRMVR